MGSRSKLPAQKDLCLYLVEAGGLQENGISDTTIRLVRQCIQDKIFSENADDICIAREDMTKNYGFGPPDWTALRNVEAVFRNPKSKSEGLVNSLIAASESMEVQAMNDTYQRKKILYFSDVMAQSLTEKEVNKLKEKLAADNICLSIVLPNKEDRNEIQETNAQILQKCLVEEGFVITTYKEAELQLASTCSKKAVRPTPWNVSLDIGADIKINVGGYVCIRQNAVSDMATAYLKDVKESLPTDTEQKAAASQKSESADKVNTQNAGANGAISSNGGSKVQSVALAKNVIQSETSWKEMDGTPVEEDKVGKGYFYGDKLIAYNELEDGESYSGGDKCFKVLVFSPKELIKPCYLIGEGTTLFYPKDGDIGSELKFDALVKAMHKANRVAIVRKVYRSGTRVVLGVLTPNTERKCLVFAELCFSDGISVPDFPLLVKNINIDDDCLVEKDQLIDELISAKTLKSPFVPCDGPADPSVLQFRNHTACKILGEPTSTGNKDIKAANSGMDNVVMYFEHIVNNDIEKPLLDKLKDTFPVKVNVIDEERASGANIFKKRQRKNDDKDDLEAKKVKIESPVKKEAEIEEDDGGMNADDLLDDL